jgi:hypothetical protein
VTVPPATARGGVPAGPAARALMARARVRRALAGPVRPVPAGTAPAPVVSAMTGRILAAHVAMAPATVARGAAARAPGVSVTIARVPAAHVAMAPATVARGAAARAPAALVTAGLVAVVSVKGVRGAVGPGPAAPVTIARVPAARGGTARAGKRPGAVPMVRPPVAPDRRGLPPTALPGMATAHGVTGPPAVVRPAPLAAARQVAGPMVIVLLAAARQTHAPLAARPLAARPATGTPGPGDHPAGPRPQDVQVLSGIARLPGVPQVRVVLGAMRTRIAVPRTGASLTAVPPRGPRPPGRAACRTSRPASPWISSTPRPRPNCGPCPPTWPRSWPGGCSPRVWPTTPRSDISTLRKPGG